MARTLVIVDAPHFYASAVVEDGVCVHAAPILSYCRQKDAAWMSAYFKRKGWKAIQRGMGQAPRLSNPSQR